MRYLTKPTQDTFLRMLAIHGNISKAVDATNSTMIDGNPDCTYNLEKSTIYRWRKKSRAFTDDMATALEEFSDRLESIALDRVTNPVGSRGSDILLLGLLNANRPSKFRNNNNGSNSADSTRELLSAVRLKLSATTNKDTSTDIVVDIGTVTTNSNPSMDQGTTNS